MDLIDNKCFGLEKLQCKELGGLIFVSLSKTDDVDFEEFTGIFKKIIRVIF